MIDQGKYKKRASKGNCKEREYHVHNDVDVAHKYVKMFCNTNQFPLYSFCGLHTKPHGVRGLNTHCHMRFDPKMGYGICATLRIPCACYECTYMLDKPWIHGLKPQKQTNY